MATEKELLQTIAEIDNVETLREIFAAIAAALRRKGVDKNPMYPEEFASLIDTVETGVDTNDADAVAEDIVRNKTAYVKGQKITGSAQEVTANNTYNMNQGVVSETSGIRLTSPGLLSDLHFRPNSKFSVTVTDTSVFGNASSSDVVSGKTFTSSSGLKKTGTASLGTNTSDATATASDIAKDKIAYGANGRITGTVAVPNSLGSQCTPQVSSSWFDFYYTVPSDQLLRSGVQINLYCPSSEIGDATAADVANDKTFTSKNGLKISGTASVYNSGEKFSRNASPSQGFSYVSTIWKNITANPILLRVGANIELYSYYGDFGDATAADVSSGKTFTAIDGFRVSGTKPNPYYDLIQVNTSGSMLSFTLPDIVTKYKHIMIIYAQTTSIPSSGKYMFNFVYILISNNTPIVYSTLITDSSGRTGPYNTSFGSSAESAKLTVSATDTTFDKGYYHILAC